jgi:DNA-binding NtrC family response regulator
LLGTSIQICLALPSALESPNRQDSAQSNFWTAASPRPDRNRAAVTGPLVGRTVADVERHLILDTLDHCLGNRTHAAKLLGISVRTLRNKLNEYAEAGIVVPEPGQRPSAVS